jgi:hypothetical protein
LIWMRLWLSRLLSYNRCRADRTGVCMRIRVQGGVRAMQHDPSPT